MKSVPDENIHHTRICNSLSLSMRKKHTFCFEVCHRSDLVTITGGLPATFEHIFEAIKTSFPFLLCIYF